MAAPEEALAALLRRDWAALAASPLLAAAAAALVAATLLLAFLLWRLLSRSRGRDAVLLLGPCGAGKTALFSLVRRRCHRCRVLRCCSCAPRAAPTAAARRRHLRRQRDQHGGECRHAARRSGARRALA
jgi:hypothetical protein